MKYATPIFVTKIKQQHNLKFYLKKIENIIIYLLNNYISCLILKNV